MSSDGYSVWLLISTLFILFLFIMFTKENLFSLKYKELIVLAKQHGVYKSRSKKAYLLDKLLPFANNELSTKHQTSADGSIDESIIDGTGNEITLSEMMGAAPAQLRRETFDVNPIDSIGAESIIEKTEYETSTLKGFDQTCNADESIIDKTGDETLFNKNDIAVGGGGKKFSMRNEKSCRLSPRRRETFEVIARVSPVATYPENISSHIDNKISLTPCRRETFDVDRRDSTVPAYPGKISSPIDNRISLTPCRRETFDIDDRDSTVPAYPGNISSPIDDSENVPPEETGKSSIVRQNTFSIDKPKDNCTPVKVTRSSVLRQNTFSVDNKVKGILEEMPGLVTKKDTTVVYSGSTSTAANSPMVKSSPRVHPFLINESHGSVVRFRSPIRTRNSVKTPASTGFVRSMAQRLESLSANRELRPASREAKLQKAEGAGTPVRVHKTSVNGGKIQKKTSARKLPNFKAIHMREFSKMESIVDHTHRKAERTKHLMTPVKLNPPKATPLSRIPIVSASKQKVVASKPTAVVTSIQPISKTRINGQSASTSAAATNRKFDITSRKSHVSNLKDKLKLIDSPMTKIKRKSAGPSLPSTSTDSEAPNSKNKKRVDNVREIVSAKMHPFSVERNRVKERDLLKNVRMNRRFQLQMEVMRKAKVN